MIEVELPDGSIAEFPDGTPPDTIKGVLQKRFAPKSLDQRISGGLKAVTDVTGGVINKAMEGLSFGLLGDEFRAGLVAATGPKNYDQALSDERRIEADFAAAHPLMSAGSEIAGAVVSPIGIPARMMQGANLATRVAKSVPASAGLAALYGFAEGEGVDGRIQAASDAAKFGAAVGAATPVIGAGVQKIADMLTQRAAIRAATAAAPSTAALRAEGQAAYDAVDAAGVQIRPQAFDRLRGNIASGLQGTGFDPLPGAGGLTPKAARVVQTADEMAAEMAAQPTAALPMKALDQFRRRAGASAGDVTNRTEAAAGSEIISQIDDFVRAMDAADVTAGDLQTMQTMLPKARDAWSRMSKSQLIDDAMEKSGNYLSGGASGMRNQFKNILNNPKLSRGFTDAEKALMRRAAQGTIPEQILYIVSGGIGNIAALTGGAAAFGPLGALAGGALSVGLRKAANSVATKNAETVRAVVAGGKMNRLPVASHRAQTLMETLLRQGSAVAPR